ncbi:hypothetical protein WMY93_024150 [Mugilogobius chulae]|uniref:Reverse transcriptase domain-containing protein n=1 Tax=Mugilogobius chulae TaxID=88201 RepID=A0AAW0NIJ9_9GOBI
MWQGLRTITDYKGPAHTPTTADQNLVEDLNKFFTRLRAGREENAAAGQRQESTGSGFHSRDPLQFAYRANRSRDDAISHVLHSTLSHLDSGRGGYVRLLFIDYSSAFNTIVPQRLTQKLGELGLSSTLCLWVQDFLTNRPQVVKMEHISPADCTATKTSNAIVKFADDTVAIGLISNNNEAAYFEEVALLSTWCKETTWSLMSPKPRR